MAASLPILVPRRGPVLPAIALLRLAALDCRAAPLRRAVGDLRRPRPRGRRGRLRDRAGPRMLPAASERRPMIWRPGSDGLSFDETWLLALARALRAGDASSVRFLAARRVRPGAGPVLRMLVAGLSAGI